MTEVEQLKADIAQLEADRERLIKERDLMRMCLNLINGIKKPDAEECRFIARVGLGLEKN